MAITTVSELHILIQVIYLLIIAMILLSNRYDNRLQDKANKIMAIIFRLIGLKVILTICRLVFSKYALFTNINIVCTMGEFALPIPVLILYVEYIKEIVRDKSLVPKKLITAIKVFSISILPLAIVSMFYPLVFTFVDGRYQEGPLINIYNGLFVIAIGLVYCVTIKCKQGFAKREFWFLLSYLVAPIMGAFLQVIINTEFNFINLGTILGMMSVYITVHMDRGRQLALKEKEMMDYKVAIMMSQIKPHFLYNSLNAIYHLCDQNPKIVQKSIGDFAEYMRANLDSINRTVPVPFEQELKHIETYLSLEKMRFDEKLHIKYDIESTGFMLPSLSIQPIVENAVNHGLFPKQDGGTVELSTKEYDDRFEIKIIDNGIGFDPDEKKNDSRSHVGIENAKHRLQTMIGATMLIESRPGQGTAITVRIPKED